MEYISFCSLTDGDGCLIINGSTDLCQCLLSIRIEGTICHTGDLLIQCRNLVLILNCNIRIRTIHRYQCTGRRRDVVISIWKILKSEIFLSGCCCYGCNKIRLGYVALNRFNVRICKRGSVRVVIANISDGIYCKSSRHLFIRSMVCI